MSEENKDVDAEQKNVATGEDPDQQKVEEKAEQESPGAREEDATPQTDIGTPEEHASEVRMAPEPGSSGDPEPPPSREGVKRVLIFLNEVAGGRKLLQASRELSEAGAEYFAVVAPQNQPAVGQLVDEDELRDAAQSRVDVTLNVLAAFGIEAEGAIMDPDSALAIDDAVRATAPDYVLLSALYESRFGLTRKDLVEWAKASLDARVEHIPVRVDDDAVRWDLTHTLVVATRTVASPDLIKRLQELASERPHRYTFICPRSGDFGREQVVEGLAQTLAEMYRNDIDATGQPMSPAPLPAIRNAIEHYRVDDILISTLAGEKSKWLEEGLIERVKELTEKPVEHLESSAAPARRAAEPVLASSGPRTRSGGGRA